MFPFQNKFQEPMISKMILASGDLGCSEEIITIAAVLSIQASPYILACPKNDLQAHAEKLGNKGV